MPTADHGGVAALTPEVHVLSFLWYAGNQCAIRNVASRFNMSESSLHRVIWRMIPFLMTIGKDVIRFPKTDEEKMNIQIRFEEIAGFPDTIGAIDGSYIPIQLPAKKIRQTYINRHDGISLTLQAICDHRRCFLDVFTGMSSKCHDAKVFQESFIFESLEQQCGHRHLVGDAAYPLRKYLLVPFKDYGNLTQAQKVYNEKLSQTRIVIENAFGILKNRFRRLRYLEMKNVIDMSQFILSCCVLHNLCITAGDLEIENDCSHLDNSENSVQFIQHPPSSDTCDTAHRKTGEAKRNLIVQILSNSQNE